MRSLLVYADGSARNDAALQSALDLARTLDAHLTLHINTPLQRFVAMDPFGGGYLIADALADAQRREAEMVARLTAQLAEEDVPWSSEHSNGLVVDGMAEAARLADLVVIALNRFEGRTDPGAIRIVGDLVLAVSCPVLAMPPHAKPRFVDGTAMVAWSGTAESANALRAAVPLLTHARAVKLVTIVEDSGTCPAADAARYLSRFNIHAELIEQPRDCGGVGAALSAAAEAASADWIVMGAYGHSRFRETLFGGVTQHLLENAPCPILLSH